MSDIFVSYARKDWAVARALVELLQASGYSVWWDKDLLGGSGFREQIGEKLRDCKAVIAIWSAEAARSDWVRGEAAYALQNSKLISTKLPGIDFAQLPADFAKQQTIVVTELHDIARALSALNVRADNPVIEQADGGAKLREAVDDWRQRGTAQISYFGPIIALLISMFVGIAVIAMSNIIGIAWVEWLPKSVQGVAWSSPKEVGYIPALSWSLTSVLLFPLAWALVILATQTLLDIRREMVAEGMLVTVQFEPITEQHDGLQRLWRDVRRMVGWLIGIVTVMILVFSLADYLTVVDRIYTDPSMAKEMNIVGPGAKVSLTHLSLERDWSIAASLDRADQVPPNPLLNRIFAFGVYILYPGVGVGIMFSFFFVIVGIGMFFLPGAARRYGLMVIPSLNSMDERRGFETFGRFFGIAVSVTGICFVVCYLMFLQNVYMRVEARTLGAFLMPRFDAAMQAFQRGEIVAALDAIVGYSFDKSIPIGAIQSVLAWFICAFMAIVLLGIAYLFLRSSALQGRDAVLEEVDTYRMSRLRRLTELDGEAVKARLKSMEAWPLRWPRLNQTMGWYCGIMTGLVFYKLGFLMSAVAIGFVFYNTFYAFEGRRQ
jgi:hypothetical protein